MLTKKRKLTPNAKGGQIHVGKDLLQVSSIKGNTLTLTAIPPIYNKKGEIVEKGKIIIKEREV